MWDRSVSGAPSRRAKPFILLPPSEWNCSSQFGIVLGDSKRRIIRIAVSQLSGKPLELFTGRRNCFANHCLNELSLAGKEIIRIVA